MFDEIKVRSTYEYDREIDILIGPYKYMQVIKAWRVLANWKHPINLYFDTKE